MAEHPFPDIGDHLAIHPTAYISPHAYVHGTVTIGADSSVWPMAVIRGDKGAIVIGARCNVQDGAILHADPDAYLTIGDNVTIGHGAIVHGALITEGMVVPSRSLVVGIPGTIKPLREDQLARIRRNAQSYVDLKDVYLSGQR